MSPADLCAMDALAALLRCAPDGASIEVIERSCSSLLSDMTRRATDWSGVLRRAVIQHVIVMGEDGLWRPGPDIDDVPTCFTTNQAALRAFERCSAKYGTAAETRRAT